MSGATIDQLQIDIQGNSTTVASSIDALVDTLEKLRSAVSGNTSGLKKISVEFASAGQSADKAYTSLDQLGDGFVGLVAKISSASIMAQKITKTIQGFVRESNKYVEDLNLFNASMGEYSREAQRYAEQVADVIGIDPAEWMRNQGIFMTITKGFGVASDKANLMSRNLTQLGYDISSFFNIDFADAMKKISSGISGELEPLRRLGYDLSVARLQEEAYALGIDEKVTAMTQAEKVQLRYYAIMTQVTTAQGDMARTLHAPANQLRILQAQFTQCGRAIGNVFIPALNAILPVAIAVTKVVRLVANVIASLLGFKLPEIDYSGIGEAGLAGAADDAADGLGGAAKKAKELKNALLGIDELNVISEPEGGKGGSGGGVGGDGGFDIPLPEYDFLGDAVNKRITDIVEKMKEWLGLTNDIDSWADFFHTRLGKILTGVMSIGVGLAGWKIARGISKFLTTLSNVKMPSLNIAAFSALGSFSFMGDLKEFFRFFEDLTVNGADISNIGGMISEFTGMIGDALMVFGKLKVGGALKIIQSFGEVISAVDSIANRGVNWDNAMSAVRGLTTFGIGLGAFTKNLKLATWSVALQGFTTVIREFATNMDAIRKGDWSSFDISTIVIGGAQGVGGVLAALGVFKKLKVALSQVGTAVKKGIASLNKATLAWSGLAAAAGLGLVAFAQTADISPALKAGLTAVGTAITAVATALTVARIAAAALNVTLSTGVLGAIGAIVAAVTAVISVFAELHKQFETKLNQAFFDNQGMAIDTYVDHYIAALETIGVASEVISDLQATIDETSRAFNTSAIELDILMGQISIMPAVSADAVAKLTEVYANMYTNLSTILDNTSQVIYVALQQTMTNATEQAKLDTQELLDQMYLLHANGSTELAGLKKSMDETITSMVGMNTNSPEFASKQAELQSYRDKMTELEAALTSNTVEQTNFNRTLEELANADINWSSTEEAQNAIEKLTEAGNNRLTQLSTDFDTAMTNLANDTAAMKALMPDSADLFDSMYDEAAAVLEENYLKNKDDIETQMRGVLSGLGGDFSTNFETAINTGLESADAWSKVKAWCMSARGLGSYDDNLKKLVTLECEEQFGGIGDALDNALANLDSSSKMTELGKSINTGVNKGMTDNRYVVEDGATAVSNAALDAFAAAQESHSPAKKYIEQGLYAVQGFVEGLTANTPLVESAMTHTANVMLSTLQDSATVISSINLRPIAEAIVTGFADGITSKQAIVKTVMMKWGTDTQKWFNNRSFGAINKETFGKYANEIIAGFKDQINRSYMNSKSSITTWASNIITWFTSVASYDTFAQIGRDVVSGFSGGLGEAMNTSVWQVSQWSTMLVQVMRDKLGIHSPSTVFGEIAENTVLGYNNTIQRMIGSTGGVMSQWANAITGINPSMKFAVDTSDMKYYNSDSFARSISTSVNTSSSVAVTGFTDGMEHFYKEYVEPTLRQIAEDMRRQADKPEQPIVKIGNKVVSEAVSVQRKANGYVFAR